MAEELVWTSRVPALICSANLRFDVEVMEKSCRAVCSVIYKLTCLMECGIRISPTRLGEEHTDRWMGEALVGQIQICSPKLIIYLERQIIINYMLVSNYKQA